MKTLLFVFGTRPEAIKTIPVLKAFEKYKNQYSVKVCVTAQHREMLDSVLAFFNVVPDYDLNIMRADQDLSTLTTRIIDGLTPVFMEVQPDVIFVHGDTTTTFSAGLAAFYHKIPVAHIEAGLRTHLPYSPYPEEMNRQLTTRLTAFHFAPTDLSRDNLLQENVKSEDIYVVGNTVIDALKTALNHIEQEVELKKEIIDTIATAGYVLPVKAGQRLVLITGHRRENFGEGFQEMCRSIKVLAEQYSDVDFVYPVHLNPNVQKPVYELLSDLSNVYLLEPLDYPQFIYMMNCADIVLTDSGGIQEEAPSLGKPVLVMRDNTERPEAVTAGTVKLVGTRGIVDGMKDLLDNTDVYQQMSKAVNPYGDGFSSDRIVEVIENVSQHTD